MTSEWTGARVDLFAAIDDAECGHDWMLRPESDTLECLICGDERSAP